MALDTWLINATGQDNLVSGAYGATLAHADFGPTPTGSFGTNFKRFQGANANSTAYYQGLNPNTGSIPLLPCRATRIEVASDTLKSTFGSAVVTGSTSGARATFTFANSGGEGVDWVRTYSNLINSANLTDVDYIMEASISNLVGTFLSGESLISTDPAINGKKIPNSAWGGQQLYYGRKIILQCLVRIPGPVSYFGFGFWQLGDWPGPVASPSSGNPAVPQIGFRYYGTNDTFGVTSSPSISNNTVTNWTQSLTTIAGGAPANWIRLRIVINEKQQYYAETGNRISYTTSYYTGDSSDTPTWTLVESYIKIPPGSAYVSQQDVLVPGFFVQTNGTTGILDIDQIEVLVEDTDVGMTIWS